MHRNPGLRQVMDTALLKGTLSLLILSLLSRKEMYGYEIAETVHSDNATGRSRGVRGRCIEPTQTGAGWPDRGRMEEKESGRKRRYYHITKHEAGHCRRKAAVVGRHVCRGQSHPGKVPWIDSIATSIRSAGVSVARRPSSTCGKNCVLISSTPWSNTRGRAHR